MQETDLKAKKLKSRDLLEDWEDVKDILQHPNLFYVSAIIYSKVISCYYYNPLARYFEIKKIKKLITRKYFEPIFCQEIKAYLGGCDVCLVSKMVCHKLYENFQSLPIPTHC